MLFLRTRSFRTSWGTPHTFTFIKHQVQHEIRIYYDFQNVLGDSIWYSIGILDPLILMSRSEDVEVLREVSSALNCLSSVEENKMEVADRALCTIIGMMLSGAL